MMMRLAFSLICGIGLLFSFCCSSVLPKDKRYVDYFLHLHAAELFRTQSFVLKKSWAYVSQLRLERVSMSFSCYKVLTVNQARKLIVSLANGLLDKINSDTELRARHLVIAPFTVDRLRLEVKTENILSENADVASVRLIVLNGPEITYETYPISSIYSGGPTIYKETFEYALMQLDDPALLDQLDNPVVRKAAPQPWTGKDFSAERPSFQSLGERVKTVAVAEEEFSQGKSLGDPQRLFFDRQELIVGDSTKRDGLQFAQAAHFSIPQKDLPEEISLYSRNELDSIRKIIFPKTGVDKSRASLFTMGSLHTSTRTGPTTDISLNEKNRPLPYGEFSETENAFHSRQQVPVQGMVDLSYRDDLSMPLLRYGSFVETENAFGQSQRVPMQESFALSYKNDLSMASLPFQKFVDTCDTCVVTGSVPNCSKENFTEVSLPHSDPFVASRWNDKKSSLDIEGGSSSLSYTLLASSALPHKPQSIPKRMHEEWSCLDRTSGFSREKVVIASTSFSSSVPQRTKRMEQVAAYHASFEKKKEPCSPCRMNETTIAFVASLSPSIMRSEVETDKDRHFSSQQKLPERSFFASEYPKMKKEIATPRTEIQLAGGATPSFLHKAAEPEKMFETVVAMTIAPAKKEPVVCLSYDESPAFSKNEEIVALLDVQDSEKTNEQPCDEPILSPEEEQLVRKQQVTCMKKGLRVFVAKSASGVLPSSEAVTKEAISETK